MILVDRHFTFAISENGQYIFQNKSDNLYPKEVEEFAGSHHSKAGRILGSLDNVLAEVVEGNQGMVTEGFPMGVSAAAVNGCWQCHGSEVKVHDRMEGFSPLVAVEITKMEFRKIDVDQDGRVFIKEVEAHFKKKLEELKHEDVHNMLHDSHYATDTSPENVQKVHDNMKIHYEEQLLGLDTVWSGSDLNDDGYISFPEYDKYVQEAHWLAHQEHLARQVLGDDMHLFDDSWREEL